VADDLGPATVYAFANAWSFFLDVCPELMVRTPPLMEAHHPSHEVFDVDRANDDNLRSRAAVTICCAPAGSDAGRVWPLG
jgi:hypothetical protein